MRNLIILMFLFASLFGCKSTVTESSSNEASTEMSLDEFCKQNKCRINKHVKFRTDEGEIDQVIPLYWPAAQGKIISILPGDELFIEAEIIDGNNIGNFKQVQKILNPSKTIRLSFTQMDSNIGMMLSVKNPFNFIMKFHLNMIDFEGNPHQTSSCPVGANISIYESWPHPIPELILSDMHIQKDSNSMSCVY